MLQKVLNNLNHRLHRNICSLQESSVESNSVNYMSTSSMTVIDFDKIKNPYCAQKSLDHLIYSNDALYVSANEEWYWIEFKYGKVQKDNVYRKIYDSLIMSIELGIIPDLEFSRKNITYILVYNIDRYPMNFEESREEIYDHLCELAQDDQALFDISHFKKYLFKNTHTYHIREFNSKFTLRMEKEEANALEKGESTVQSTRPKSNS